MPRQSTRIRHARKGRRPGTLRLGPWPRGPRPRRGGLWMGVIAVLLVLVGPRVGDVVNGLVTRTDGCRIWVIVDGDTVRMSCPVSGWQTTRLIGFDTPEFRGSCARERGMAWLATQALRWHLWRAGEISVAERGADRFDRRLARVLVDGVPLAGRMVETGLARAYAGGPRRGWCG